MSKKKLFLVTDMFPFGHGESFLEAEIEYLSKRFDLTIISCADESARQSRRDIPQGIDLHGYEPRKVVKKYFSLIYCVPLFLLSKFGYQECIEIIKSKEGIVRKLKSSLLFYTSAHEFYVWMRKSNIIKPNECSIYYSYWNTDKVLAMALYRNKVNNIHIVSRIHGYDLYNEREISNRQPFKRQMNAMVDLLCFVSGYGKKYYEDHFGKLPDEKSGVRYLGTTNGTAVKDYRKNAVFNLVSCSNVIPIKRVSLIVYALRLIQDIQISWTHIGSGEALPMLRALANDVITSKENIRFSFLGQLSNADIHRYYQSNQVDCFITASVTEGAPVSVMEALSYGIPVIATAVGGIPEMLEDSGNILLDQDPSADEISKAIENMRNMDEASMIKLRIRCRQLWEQKFSADLNYTSFANELSNMID